MPDEPKAEEVKLKRAPTLYAIIALKIAKGLFCVALAVFLYTHSDKDLPAEFQNLLKEIRANPDSVFWTKVASQVATITEATMRHFALGTLIYSLFSLVEGVGMMFRVSWAGWLCIGESIFFIPIELNHLLRPEHVVDGRHVAAGFSWLVLGIFVVNIFIVWYLFKNRARLFHHHQHHHPQPAAGA
jgi:uncharacterized membrane protein (DUF2068 family)